MRIKTHRELNVWNKAMDTAMTIFVVTKHFPPEEKYSMVDQIRRSSRSVAANIAEAWRKRRYRAAFISKLSDSESEACETQVWIEFALRCGYLSPQEADNLNENYETIIRQIVTMVNKSEDWLV
jgi:four helix bundle protein